MWRYERPALAQANYDAWPHAGLDQSDARVSVQAEPIAGPPDLAFGFICRLQDDLNVRFDNFVVSEP